MQSDGYDVDSTKILPKTISSLSGLCVTRPLFVLPVTSDSSGIHGEAACLMVRPKSESLARTSGRKIFRISGLPLFDSANAGIVSFLGNRIKRVELNDRKVDWLGDKNSRLVRCPLRL